MKPQLTLLAPLLLATPLFAQLGPPPPPAPSPVPHTLRAHAKKHRDPQAMDQMMDMHQQMGEEMEDFDALGLPEGDFWQSPMMVQNLALTPDQVKRLADVSLQSRLQLIQLEAALQTEQLKLEPLTAGPTIDTQAALAQVDRIAESRAAIEKAEARMAFGLRVILTPDQVARLHGGPDGMMRPGRPNRKPAQ